ncbi:hypothetical protein [Clostridium pasteurianum]|uniref:Uncharacterized protein n=1 Tax=Clostridium pasteurianum BC1 TaxID=86416 RepID=R4KA74_CLOPA|nr:hypothetical protein [Clostridium pasteurianum]AGK96515.1 hypothetical protein Clopa_1587 [Clostridium pasteurianum BC1]
MYYNTYNRDSDINNNNQEIGEDRVSPSMNPGPSMNPNPSMNLGPSMNPKPYHHVNKKYPNMPSMAPHTAYYPMMMYDDG